MILMGIDPGSLNFGYGIVRLERSDVKHVAHGVIKNTSDKPLPERILKISRELEKVLEQFNPQFAVIERIFLAKNADSAFKLGHVRGAAILECMKHNCSIVEYSAKEVKKGISGFGGAEKSQVLFMVQHILGIHEPLSFDAADALALAIYHSQRADIDQRILEEMR